MKRLQLAIEQIVFARNYTIGLLDHTPMAEWFRQPPGGVSHVGWQVGHIAFSEYRLALWRIRGTQPQDDALFSQEFKRLFWGELSAGCKLGVSSSRTTGGVGSGA